MGRRHQLNATNSSCYTYHERKKDAAASGFGSEGMRLGKDSIKEFDCCSLTLQPCRYPVVTRDGWLYDKEAILKYLIEKKEDYRRKQKAYEAQTNREFKELHKNAEKDLEKQKEFFEKQEQNICSDRKSSASSSRPSSTSTSSSSKPLKDPKSLPFFWVPNLTPMADATKLKKPDKTIYCPMSGKPLKMKELIEVKLSETKAETDKEGKTKSLISRVDRYKCAVTNDILRNTTTLFVLKPTGDVVTKDCVEKIIRPDMVHPLTGAKLEKSDLIELARGGTGYSSSNEILMAKSYRPSLAIN